MHVCVCLYQYTCTITVVLLFFSTGIANVSFHWSDSSLALPSLSYTTLPTLSGRHHVKPKTFKEDIRRGEDREQCEDLSEETMTEPHCLTRESAVAHTQLGTLDPRENVNDVWTHQMLQLKLRVEKGQNISLTL